MSRIHRSAVIMLGLATALTLGCSSSTESNTSVATNTGSTTTKSTPPKPDADGVLSSATGVEKEKPAAGKANVQGKALFNGKPAVGVEVKLCEKFNRYIGGCGGETYTTKTDASGEYLIKEVTPRIYEGLTVKVFDTPFFIFATSGIVATAKYNIEADKTFFAPDTNLFKSDLKLVNPKAGAKIASDKIEVKWDAYPEAAYYKFSVHGDSSTGADTEYDYINKRVDGTSYVLDKPLKPGSYRVEVVAFNGNDVKLATSPDDIKFSVTEGAK